jgi:hypothetical protein
VVLFYHLTTHVEGDKDQELLRSLSGRAAFPTVLYLTPEGTVLHKHVGDRTTRSFQREIHGYFQLHLARKELAAGKPDAQLRILQNQLKLELMNHETASRAYKALDARLLARHPREATAIRQALVRLEAKEVYFGVIKGKTSADRDRNRARRAHEMYAAGRIPEDANAWLFWKLLLLHAEATNSRTLFDRAAKEYLHLREGRISAAEQERVESLRRKLHRQL